MNRHKSASLNVLVAFAAAVTAFVASIYSMTTAGLGAACFAGLAFFVCVVSWFQMRLEEQDRIEQLEANESRRSGSTAIFDAAETSPARRARRQFERIFVPALTIVLLLLQGGAAWWLWQRFNAQLVPVRQPVLAMAALGIVGLTLFLLGKYAAGISRLEGQRLLRPQAGYLLLTAYSLALAVLALAAVEAGFPHVDRWVGYALVVLLGLSAIEAALRLLLEIYRPRIEGKVGPPLYESRAVSILSQPGSLVATAAHTLDYQFGFKVSETWFYRSATRAARVLIPAQVVLLLLSTCFVFIDTGEQGLLERNGTFRTLIDPGAHLKLPWPIERVYRYPTDQILRFNVGYVHHEEREEDHEHDEPILWTVSHYKEEFHLLVANRAATDTTTNAAGVRRSPPVSLLSVSIPVQYQIKNLKAWAYNHQEPGKLLEAVGTREVVRYLVSADLQEFMSSGRFKAGDELRERIQKEADDLDLGVNILLVGLQDVHPPVKVASAYETVIGAEHRRRATVLGAEAYRVQTNALAAAEAFRQRNNAQAESLRLQADTRARAALFTNQVAAYRASPPIYTLRSYLEILRKEGASARKYVLATTNTQDVIMLNLEDKIYSTDPLNIMRNPGTP